jgi:hypothetical protein
VGSAIGYIIDILFAKKCFIDHSTGVMNLYKYTREGLVDRLKWLIRSFATLSFLKYGMLTLLDTLLVTKLLERTKRLMEDNKILVNHKAIRNAAASVIITSITFNLFVNILRFKWVYTSGPDDIILNTIIVMWMSLLFFYEDTRGVATKTKEE